MEPHETLAAVAFAGVSFTTANSTRAAQTIIALSQGAPPRHVHFLNAYTMSLIRSDAQYRGLFQHTSLNFADGRPLAALISRRSNVDSHARGPKTFATTLDIGRAAGVRHYLFGGSSETLSALQEKLEETYPGVQIVGSYSPPFRLRTAEERADEIAAITSAKPHVVWVGLGTPKQDWEAVEISARSSVTAIAVGAAFDFVAGTKPTSPAVMSHLGLEWLFRLLTEPRRLWRRYLFGNSAFLWMAARETRRFTMTKQLQTIASIRADVATNHGVFRAQVLLVLFRLAHHFRTAKVRLSRAAGIPVIALYRTYSAVLGVDIPARTSIGPGLSIRHPQGIVINGNARIGASVTLKHNVTIGVAGNEESSTGAPVLRDNVMVGNSATIIGDIVIEEFAVVGSNAVVVKSVPAAHKAVGVPAHNELSERQIAARDAHRRAIR